MKILVTGGAGYIGSHVARHLRQSGFTPLILDNLSRGHRRAAGDNELIVGDLTDTRLLDSIFDRHEVHAVMHFASLSEVGESIEAPARYYRGNLVPALNLLDSMLAHGVRKLVFSSTCAVYGSPEQVPIEESHPRRPISAYGETKYFLERILAEYERRYGLSFVSLRYFNAGGASLDGSIGESHQPETHLIPRILQAALDPDQSITILGVDYPTPDGTCIRDYIHVLDLASAHLAAYRYLEAGSPSRAFNLGTSCGHSVLEVIETAREVTGRRIRTQTGSRRSGDPHALVCDPSQARSELDWEPCHSELNTIVETAWRWHRARQF